MIALVGGLTVFTTTTSILAQVASASEPDAIAGRFARKSESPAAAITTSVPKPLVSSPAVPPGFEDLLDPQLTVVDVYFSGRPVGSSPATTTPEFIQFESPKELLALVDDIRPDAIDMLAEELSGSLPVNTQFACFPTPAPRCGELAFETIAVVYEPAIFRVDLYIAAAYLEVQAINLERFLPPPDNKFANLTTLSGTLSGQSSDLDVGASLRNYASYGATHLFTNVSFRDNEGAVVENLTAQQHSRHNRAQAGFFPLQEMDVVAGFELLGASFQASNQLRLDLLQIQGTELVVFLALRSRVSIFKDGQLVGAGFYEPGNQVLDTHLLPLGAYFVTIEITDARGVKTTQTRFFVKSVRLPPFEAPNYWLAAGTLVDDDQATFFPETSSNATVGGGGAIRITDSLALGADLLASRRQLVGEFDVIYQFEQLELVSDLLLTPDGFVGQALTLLGQSEDYSFFLNWRGIRRIFGADNPDPSPDPRAVESRLSGGTDRFVDRDTAQLNARLNYRFGDLQSGLFGSLSSNEGIPRSYSIGVEGRYVVIRNESFIVQLVGTLSRTQDTTLGLLTLAFTNPIRPWLVSGSFGQQVQRFDAPSDIDRLSVSGSGRLAWDDEDLLPRDQLRAAINSDYRSDVASQRADVSYDTAYGRAAASSAFSNDLFSYSLTGSTSVLVSEDGVSAGGRESNSSGVVIEVLSQDPEATFDLVLNGREWGSLSANERTPITVPPFQRYTIEVRPRSSLLVDIERSQRQVILYPGNVAFVSFATREIVVLVASLLDEQGRPLGNASVSSEAESTSTDEAGFFQLTAGEGETLTVKRSDGKTCKLETDGLPVQDGLVLPKGPMQCSSLASE